MMPIVTRSSFMYTLKQGNKTIGFYSKDRPYVIGFKKLVHARSVHYAMHPEPKFQMVKSDDVMIKEGIEVFLGSTIFIPKCAGSSLEPINDGGFHLHTMKSEEFYGMPFKGVGVVLAYELLDEDINEFTFRAHIIRSYVDDEMSYLSDFNST